MLAHKDDFMPFLASIDGEDTAAAASHEGLMTEQEFTKYCFNVAETGEWGGEPEVRRLDPFIELCGADARTDPGAVAGVQGADPRGAARPTDDRLAWRKQRWVRGGAVCKRVA